MAPMWTIDQASSKVDGTMSIRPLTVALNSRAQADDDPPHVGNPKTVAARRAICVVELVAVPLHTHRVCTRYEPRACPSLLLLTSKSPMSEIFLQLWSPLFLGG